MMQRVHYSGYADQFTDMYMYMAKYCTLHNLRDPLDGIIRII